MLFPSLPNNTMRSYVLAAIYVEAIICMLITRCYWDFVTWHYKARVGHRILDTHNVY